VDDEPLECVLLGDTWVTPEEYKEAETRYEATMERLRAAGLGRKPPLDVDDE
jgi:hypothetical protein